MADRTVSLLNKPSLDALIEEHNQLVTALGATGGILHYEEAQTGDVITTADSTDTATRVALVNIIRAKYVAHIASTAKHRVADATNTVTAPAATNDVTAQTLANELKVDLNAHQILVTNGVHRGKGGAGSPFAVPAAIATADGTDATTTGVLINVEKAVWNFHIQSGAQNILRSGT